MGHLGDIDDIAAVAIGGLALAAVFTQERRRSKRLFIIAVVLFAVVVIVNLTNSS